METAVVWKAAMNPRLPTPLGKRFAFPTAPTAPATSEKRRGEPQETPKPILQNLTYTTRRFLLFSRSVQLRSAGTMNGRSRCRCTRCVNCNAFDEREQ